MAFYPYAAEIAKNLTAASREQGYAEAVVAVFNRYFNPATSNYSMLVPTHHPDGSYVTNLNAPDFWATVWANTVKSAVVVEVRARHNQDMAEYEQIRANHEAMGLATLLLVGEGYTVRAEHAIYGWILVVTRPEWAWADADLPTQRLA